MKVEEHKNKIRK